MQNLTILSLAVPEISLGAQKYKVSHVTLITPLLKVICRRIPGLDIAHLCTKFDRYSFSRSRDVVGSYQNLKKDRQTDGHTTIAYTALA